MHRAAISVYPGTGTPLEEQLSYVRKAASLGFCGVFSSLLLPVTMGLSRSAMQEVTKEASAVALEARELGMWAATDVSDRVFEHYGASPQDLAPFAEMGFTGIRIDAGFTPEQLGALSQNPEGLNITINCAMTSAADLERVLETGCPDRLGASFNFYPRPESGVSLAFVASRAEEFCRRGIPVSAFVPSQRNRRGPLFAGLPTVEDHRYLPPERGARQLFATGAVTEVILGDPLAPEEELRALVQATSEPGIAVGVRIRPDLTETERRVLDQLHHVREDEAAYVIRSDRARGLLKREGGSIVPRPPEKRPRFAVTVDNAAYGRYMGELQICLRTLPPDGRVNVIGMVDAPDRVLLDFLTGGRDFRLYVV